MVVPLTHNNLNLGCDGCTEHPNPLDSDFYYQVRQILDSDSTS
jgi:hypothetical protein